MGNSLANVSSAANGRTIFPGEQPRSRMPASSHQGGLAMENRVAVITGAGSGIGRATALNLMAAGWSVALAGRRKEALEETAGMAKAGKALVQPTDVTDPAQVDALFAKVKSTFG